MSVILIQQFQMKIMETKSECALERFNLPYNIIISEVCWWDIEAFMFPRLEVIKMPFFF